MAFVQGQTSGSSGVAEPVGAGGPLPGARGAMLLLLCINLFNYIDRYVLAAVGPDVCRNLLSIDNFKDPNAKTKMGMLATAFLVTYMCISPIFGVLAERRSRWMLIAIGVALWSLASGASGLAMTFTALLITRCFVGVGEAAYGPVAPTIIADMYPVASRGRVLSWFYMAIPIGSALGFALGAQVAGLDRAGQSWRWAFYAVVPPGLLLGLWSMLMRDPQRGGVDVASPPRRATMKDYLVLLRTKSYVLDTLGMTAMTFAMGGIGWWMPDYLDEKGVKPTWGVEPATIFGGILAAAGLLGTMAGGLLGDRLRARFSGSYFLVSGVAMLVGAPCFLLFLFTPFPAAWIFVFISVFLLFFNTGPTNTILANVTHPSMRATAFAANIFIIHAFGDAISPPVIGAIVGRSNWTVGFMVMSVFMVIGGLLWLKGTTHLAADTAAAPMLCK